MIPILNSSDWLAKILKLNEGKNNPLLAFYDHRVKAITTDYSCLSIPLDDHLVHRGDGVFENIKFINRMIVNLDAHLDRLENSAKAIFLKLPCSKAEIKEIILQVAKASADVRGHNSGLLRVIVGRGAGGFDIDPKECESASLYIVAHKAVTIADEKYKTGLKAAKSSVPVRSKDQASIKSVNYLHSVLMCIEATDKNVDLTFSFDHDNFLAEAAIANVCIIDKDNNLIVPDSKNILMGTTVKRAMEFAKTFIKVYNKSITEQDIFNAKEVLVLGTVHECISVVEYEGQKIGNGLPGNNSIIIRKKLQEQSELKGITF